jgi:hypothetical protein
MRRLLRWAFNFAAAVSAFLLLATCALWVRSYSYTYLGFISLSTMAAVTIAAGNGGFYIDLDVELPPEKIESYISRYPSRVGEYGSVKLGQNLTTLNRLGFAGDSTGKLLSKFYTWAVMPMWLLELVMGVIPAAWLHRRAIARRAAGIGLCPACGYDLRATPDRCPECGAVPKGAT